MPMSPITRNRWLPIIMENHRHRPYINGSPLISSRFPNNKEFPGIAQWDNKTAARHGCSRMICVPRLLFTTPETLGSRCKDHCTHAGTASSSKKKAQGYLSPSIPPYREAGNTCMTSAHPLKKSTMCNHTCAYMNLNGTHVGIIASVAD